MTVGNQLNSHFSPQQMGRSLAPYPCRPHHGHPPQNQRIPLLCVTDHSSGHTKEWESLTPTRGATQKRGKTLPGAPTYCHGGLEGQEVRGQPIRLLSPTLASASGWGGGGQCAVQGWTIHRLRLGQTIGSGESLAPVPLALVADGMPAWPVRSRRTQYERHGPRGVEGGAFGCPNTERPQ